MKRTIVYPKEQPTDTLWLNAERNKMLALGWLGESVLGTDTVADGFSCIPTVPPSLAVQILPGALYAQEPVDSTVYGSLGADAVRQVVKQGLHLDVSSLTLSPPATAGQAIDYLIEAAISELDTEATVLPYFNSASPADPLLGPGGSGVSQQTVRDVQVSLVAKAGVAAAAGTQVPPAPDVGYVGLWVVTVAQGATALTGAQIATYVDAPFIAVKLPEMPRWVQGGSYGYAVDAGTANQIIVTLDPKPASIGPGFEINVRKIGTASNDAVTIIVNGAPPVAVTNATGGALTAATPIPASYRTKLVFDGAGWAWVNAQQATAIGSLSASSGEGIDVSGGGIVSLAYPGLAVQPVLANTDLWSFYSQGDAHHRIVSWAQLLAALGVGLPPSLFNVRVWSSPGTFSYVPTTSGLFTARKVFGFVTGPGGSGATGYGGGGHGGGGGAGETTFFYGDAVAASVVIGAGGPVATGTNGYPGVAPSSFGSAVANPGGGGLLIILSNNDISMGGLGGTGGSGGIFSIPGGPGFGGHYRSGNGGSSFIGPGGRFGNVTAPALAGSLGGGGGGCQQGATSGAGGDGFCLALEFI